MKLVLTLAALFCWGCASAPSKQEVDKKFLTESVDLVGKAQEVEKALTLGANQLTAGYSVEVTLYTAPLIAAKETEKGKLNMDSDEKIKKNIKQAVEEIVTNKTFFLVTVHTYSLQEARFENWVAKLKTGDSLTELKFNNVKGLQSVPSTHKDGNGRNWHNTSFACGGAVSKDQPLTLYLIPQIKNNADGNGASELTWHIKK